MTLDEQQVRILELIASGHSYDQIVAALGDGTYHDIFGAAQAALDTIEHRGPAYSVEEVRRQYPNAYRPWDPASDQQLVNAFFGGASDEDLSGQFGRSIGAIQSRLLKALRGKLGGPASVGTEPPTQTSVPHSAYADPSFDENDAPQSLRYCSPMVCLRPRRDASTTTPPPGVRQHRRPGKGSSLDCVLQGASPTRADLRTLSFGMIATTRLSVGSNSAKSNGLGRSGRSGGTTRAISGMAIFYPSSPPQGIPDSERQVWHALTRLDDSWSVFHGLRWQGERGERQGEGEGDFVLLHPETGMVFLEVKGGRELRIIDGQWYRQSGPQLSRIADPFEQVRSTQHEVIRRIRAELDISGLSFGHAVVFPHLTSADGLGLQAHDALVMTRGNLQYMAGAIDRVVSHWGLSSSLSPDDESRIMALLSPTTVIRTRLADDLILVREKIEAWTREQVLVLDGLARNRRALVYGGAGTGKTILAMEKARRLAKDGATVQLVTFNVPLAVWIATAMRDVPSVQVFHFHGLVRSLADKARKVQAEGSGRIRFTLPAKLDSGWYEGPDAELLVDAAEATGYDVDAIVVDEGQDFAPHHWTALELLLADPSSGEYHVFLDRHQALYRSDWEPPFDGLSYDLRKNCRNTRPIAELVSLVMDQSGEPAMVEGPDVVFIPIENVEGATKALKRTLDEVVNQGRVPAREVAILTSDRSLVDNLVGTSIAGVRLVKPPSLEGVRVDTIHRFKGLEADAVFLILPEAGRGEGGALEEYQRKLAYVGLSRPRSYLCVLAREAVGTALGLV